MTYGELETMNFGWVGNHVMDDECSNARFCYGKNWRKQQVPASVISKIQQAAQQEIA